MGKHWRNVKLNTETICNKLPCSTRSEHWMEDVDKGRLKQLGGGMERNQNGLRKGGKREHD